MNPLAGPLAALRGLGLILSSPGLMLRATLPGVAALILSGIGIWAAIRWHTDLMNLVWTRPVGEGSVATLLNGLWAVINWVLGLAAALLSVVITPWLVMLVGLPLCEPLSGAVDAKLGGRAVPGKLVAELAQTLTTTLVVTSLGLAGAMAFFVLGLIPGLGLVLTPFVILVWTPLFLAFDLFDSPLARRQRRLGQKFGFLREGPVAALSVGLTATALVAIPILNLVGLPVAVAMGVIVVRDREQRAGREA